MKMYKRRVAWVIIAGVVIVFLFVAGPTLLSIYNSVYNSGVGIFW